MGFLRYLLVGAAVLAVTFVLWWALATGLGHVIDPRYAGMVALGIILVGGWIANALLVVFQVRRARRKSP